MTRPSRGSWGRRPRGERPRSGDPDAPASRPELDGAGTGDERSDAQPMERAPGYERGATARRRPQRPGEVAERRAAPERRTSERRPPTERREGFEPRDEWNVAQPERRERRPGVGARSPRPSGDRPAPRSRSFDSDRAPRSRSAAPVGDGRGRDPRQRSGADPGYRGRPRSRAPEANRSRDPYPSAQPGQARPERGRRDWSRPEGERTENARRGQPRREAHLGGPVRRSPGRSTPNPYPTRTGGPRPSDPERTGNRRWPERGQRSPARDSGWSGSGFGAPSGNVLDRRDEGRRPAGRREPRPGADPRPGRDRRPPRPSAVHRAPAIAREVVGEADGILELTDRGFGFLRQARRMYHPTEDDVFVPPALVKQLKLREGLKLSGPVGRARNGGLELLELAGINDLPMDAYERLVTLEELTPTDPDERLRFATGPEPVTTRVIDLLTPVGKGQRALIVAPPRSGKTVLLQHMAHGISENHPEVKLKVLLVDERPEEVTDMKRTVRGEVVASSSDMNSDAHVRVAELVLEQARREVEFGHDVVIFLDSLTRLGRAYNRETGSSGRTLTGGIDARALERPKRIFGAARNVEHGGSLTIIATALIETGSRMDEVIFQEFKGTGNMEMVLERTIADMRIWPALDVRLSGTRKEEKLYTAEELPRVRDLRRLVAAMDPLSAIQEVLTNLDFWEGRAAKVPVRRVPSSTR